MPDPCHEGNALFPLAFLRLVRWKRMKRLVKSVESLDQSVGLGSRHDAIEAGYANPNQGKTAFRR